jgi:hypothetical protein
MNDHHGDFETSVRSTDRTRLIDCAQTAGGFGRRRFYTQGDARQSGKCKAPRVSAGYCPTNMNGTFVTVSPSDRGNAHPFTASSMQWASPG